jgi:hypothetical protein
MEPQIEFGFYLRLVDFSPEEDLDPLFGEEAFPAETELLLLEGADDLADALTDLEEFELAPEDIVVLLPEMDRWFVLLFTGGFEGYVLFIFVPAFDLT